MFLSSSRLCASISSEASEDPPPKHHTRVTEQQALPLSVSELGGAAVTSVIDRRLVMLVSDRYELRRDADGGPEKSSEPRLY